MQLQYLTFTKFKVKPGPKVKQLDHVVQLQLTLLMEAMSTTEILICIAKRVNIMTKYFFRCFDMKFCQSGNITGPIKSVLYDILNVQTPDLNFQRSYTFKRFITSNMAWMTILCILSLFVHSSGGFCVNDRLLFGRLSRSSMQAAEFLRRKLMDKDVFTNEGIQGHHLGVTLHSLRSVGYTVGALSDLTVGKVQFDDIIKNLNTSTINTGQAAYYLYGSLAVCQDPQQYSALVEKLKTGIPTYPNVGQFNHPFQYGLAVLALCKSGNGQSSYPQYAIKLKELINQTSSLHHVGDTLGLLTMALACIYDDAQLHNDVSVKQTISDAATQFISSQKSDGSFGNSITTAIAVQTILTIKETDLNVDIKRWDCKKTMEFLLSRQAPDGSFIKFLMSVTQVLPALIGAIPSDIPRKIKCPPKPNPTPQPAKIQVCIRIEFLTTAPNGQQPTTPPPFIGTFDNGTKAYDVCMAAHNSKQYTFTGVFGPYGYSVRGIYGVLGDPANYKYWMIYKGPFPGVPGPITSTGTGVSSFIPKDKTCLIFRYTKLSFKR